MYSEMYAEISANAVWASLESGVMTDSRRRAICLSGWPADSLAVCEHSVKYFSPLFWQCSTFIFRL